MTDFQKLVRYIMTWTGDNDNFYDAQITSVESSLQGIRPNNDGQGYKL